MRKTLPNERRPEATPYTMRVRQAVESTGLSRTKLFAIMRTGEVESRKVGRARLLLVESLRAYIGRQPGSR